MHDMIFCRIVDAVALSAALIGLRHLLNPWLGAGEMQLVPTAHSSKVGNLPAVIETGIVV